MAALSAAALAVTAVPVLAVSQPAGAVAGPWAVVASYPASVANLVDIACPSATECIAVGSATDSSNTSNAVIYATTDGGKTWSPQTVPSSMGTGFDTSLESVTCPSSSDCFAFGYSSNLAEVILGTTDSGSTWSVQYTIDAFGGTPDITCASTSDCYALTDGNGGSSPSEMFATTTGGATWASVPIPTDLPQLVAMTCPSVATCLIVGGVDVIETTDGGSSWTTQQLGGENPPTFSLDSVDCPSSTTCFAAGGDGAQAATSGGVVFTSTDSGSTWTPQSVPIANIDDLACTSTLDCFAGGFKGSAASLLTSTDGGATWDLQSPNPGSGAIASLSCTVAATCFAVQPTGQSTSDILEGPGAPLVQTTTTVGASPSPVAAGQSVTYTASVQPSNGAGTPTGSVAFSDGSTTLCTATLMNGTGSCSASTSTVPLGTNGITGTYSGDATFAASAGSTTLDVQDLSDTLVNIQPEAASFGQAVTYSATVLGSVAETPTGTVSFATGTTALCTATLANGTGSCSASAAPLGSDIVAGTYSGDEYLEGSTGYSSVQIGLTKTSVTVSPTSVSFQQPVTYAATVTPLAGSGTPSGTVSFAVGATALCAATLANGTASCTADNAPLTLRGQDPVVGTYSGDGDFVGSTGSASLSVGATSTTVTVQPNSLSPGQGVTFNAVVAPEVGGGTPTGSVTFGTGATSLCSATLSGGDASCSASNAPAGNDTVTGVYSGDSSFAGSEGSAPLVVGPTTTVVTASPSSVAYEQAVTYAATVSSTLGTGTPTGTVVFSAGGMQVCTGTLKSGTASCLSAYAPPGVDTVSAVYSGDISFAGSTGTTTLAVGTSTTTVSVDPSTVASGEAVTFDASVVTPSGIASPSGSVAFSAGTTNLCSAPVVNGTASCTAANAPGGDDTVTGAYSGDAAVAGSAGSTTLVVGPTSTAVSVSPTSIPTGEDVTYSAAVTSTLGSGVPTGTVSFSFEGYALCTATLSAGSGSCTTVSDGTVGDNTVVGTYSGDANYAGSSGSTTLTETPDHTSTVFSYDEEYGQVVSFSASVNPVGVSCCPPYAGTVTFSAGATTLCAASYVSSVGQFACTATDVPWGKSTVTAAYSGDNLYAGSSETLSLFLAGTTVTSVETVPGAHAGPGQSVTYSANVSGPGQTSTPSGSVSFTVGSTNLCTATLSGGSGSCSAANAPQGTEAVVGTYSGDSSFGSSLGWTTLFVGVLAQTITFTSSPTDPVYGAKYAVSAMGGGSGNPVTFTSATTKVCKMSTSAVVTFVALGTCTIDADQAGNAGFTAASQAQQSFAVTRAPTMLVAVDEGPTSKAMSATLTRSSDGKPVESQQVKFTIGGVTKCTAYTNAQGVAKCSLLGTRPAGSPTYVATYAGTVDYLPSSGSAPL